MLVELTRAFSYAVGSGGGKVERTIRCYRQGFGQGLASGSPTRNHRQRKPLMTRVSEAPEVGLEPTTR